MTSISIARAVIVALAVSTAAARSARAQDRDGGTPEGAAVFSRACASCHDGRATTRAPGLESLRGRAPQAILDVLLTGAMRMQGARLTGAERRAVTEYVTGKSLDAPSVDPGAGRCAADAPAAVLRDIETKPMWNGWGPSVANTRNQPAAQAGLTAAQVPRLKLKWAIGFPDATVAFSQPTVAGGRVFVGSHGGTVYSLDAKSGCVYWTFNAKAAVRTALPIARRASGPGYALFFGDLSANVYAVDAATGALLWTRQVDAHPYARITGSPTLYENRLYVPVASLEEGMAGNAEYACCTFRGSLAVLDAATGREVWRTYPITEPLLPRGKNRNGLTLQGPSGAPIWTSPTIDPKRHAVYVATGNMYTGPQQPTSDAVLAMDLDSGAIKWTRQMTPKDIFPCRPGGNCLEDEGGPDFDFGSSPMLTSVPGGKDVIVIGQKSGVGWALDPDRAGAVLWQYRAGEGGTLGGIEWGSGVDAENAYFPVSDIQRDHPGGLHAVALATGERVWYAPAPAPLCGTEKNCNGAQSAAITVIPGVIFSGSNDGGIRAYSARDGSILWQYDTNRAFETVNRVPAHGASLIGPGPAVAGGMVFVNSGYGQYGGRPGNVFLAFGID